MVSTASRPSDLARYRSLATRGGSSLAAMATGEDSYARANEAMTRVNALISQIDANTDLKPRSISTLARRWPRGNSCASAAKGNTMKSVKGARLAIAVGLAVLVMGPAWAVEGRLSASGLPAWRRWIVSTEGALQSIVVQYMTRWDAREAMPRDWDAILAGVPKEYFDRSNKSLANTVGAEKRKGNG